MKILQAVRIVMMIPAILFLILSITSDREDTTYLAISLFSLLVVNGINVYIGVRQQKEQTNKRN